MDTPEAALAPHRETPFRHANQRPDEQTDGQSDDRAWLDARERWLAAEVDAALSAQERIANAINAIRAFHSPQSSAAEDFPPEENRDDWGSRDGAPGDAADEAAAPCDAPPFDDDCDAVAPRPPSSLEPDVVPPPAARRRGGFGASFTQTAFTVGLAALAAAGIAMLPALQHGSGAVKRSADAAAAPERSAPEKPRERPTPAPARLMVEDERAFANEPILLDVAVAPATGSGSLALSGLARGTRLSAGAPLGEAAWELPLRAIGGVYVYAPQDFVGVMNAMIALLSPRRALMDRRPMRLEWIAKTAALRPVAKQEAGGESAAAAVKPMDPQQAAALMERGRSLLGNGDVALAQLAFRRLADAGHADAALALATTYDPRYLAAHKFIGVAGDETKARAWYQRARALGSAEATRILQRLDKE